MTVRKEKSAIIIKLKKEKKLMMYIEDINNDNIFKYININIENYLNVKSLIDDMNENVDVKKV